MGRIRSSKESIVAPVVLYDLSRVASEACF